MENTAVGDSHDQLGIEGSTGAWRARDQAAHGWMKNQVWFKVTVSRTEPVGERLQVDV